MYHSVPAPEWAPWIAPRNRMSAGQFEGQIRYLKKNRNVMALGELVRLLREAAPLPPRTVVVTLDDGYRDNLDIVAPILERHGVPATIYLCTAYVTRSENQWADVVYGTLRHRSNHVLRLSGDVTLDLHDPNQLGRACAQITGQLLSAGREQREELLADLGRQLEPTGRAPRLTLTWDEVRQLARDHPTIELGTHTDEHLDLTARSVEDAVGAIRRSQETFEQEVGRPAIHFSFPYSRSSKSLITQLPSLGIETAMTGIGRLQASSDPLDLRRREAPASSTLLRIWTGDALVGLPRWVQRRQ